MSDHAVRLLLTHDTEPERWRARLVDETSPRATRLLVEVDVGTERMPRSWRRGATPSLLRLDAGEPHGGDPSPRWLDRVNVELMAAPSANHTLLTLRALYWDGSDLFDGAAIAFLP